MRPAAPFCLAVSLAAAGANPSTEWLQAVQLGASANPSGLRLLWSGSIRRTFEWRTAEDPWSSLEGGTVLALTPAFGQAGLFAEWQPVPVLVLRIQGDQQRSTGHYGGTLSFAQASDPFGTPDLERRRGEEEPAGARRALVRTTLQYQAGPLVLRAPLSLLWTRAAGRGPWLYDPEYDTLLRDGDRLQDLQFQVGWNGRVQGGWLTWGPGYHVTRTREAGLERRRAGLFAYFTRPRALGPFQRPYLAVQAGRVLRDPNRTGQIYTEAALGARLGR